MSGESKEDVAMPDAAHIVQLELAFHRALTKFQTSANSSYDSAETTTASLLQTAQAWHQADKDGFESSVVHQLCTVINLVLAIDAGGDDHSPTMKVIANQARRHQLTPAAMDNLRSLTQLLGREQLKDRISVELFDAIDDIVHILAKPPPKSESTASWNFTPNFRLEAEKSKVVFDSLQHVVHNLDDVISILQDTDGLATFKGKINKDYYGPDFWWLAPRLSDESDDIDVSVPSLDMMDSRYGPVRFTFPAHLVFARFKKCFLLGTRSYNAEYAHTLMLTNVTACGLSLPLEEISVGDNPLVQLGADKKAVWSVGRISSNAWDHLEFAAHMDESMSFDPSKNEVRIDFVSHEKYCVINKRPIEASYRNPKPLPCKCSRKKAMEDFKLACRNAGIFEGLRPFFEEDLWEELQAVNV